MTFRLCILAAMIWCHIFDDYVLQGILAQFKQKTWWKEHAPNKLYKNDWIIALFEHAFSWSFSICVPLFILMFARPNAVNAALLPYSYIINTIIHAFIDHLKCNKLCINLMIDQYFHLLQIILTWIAIVR